MTYKPATNDMDTTNYYRWNSSEHVWVHQGRYLRDDVLRKKMGETGLMKTVAHVDYQKRNRHGYCYGRFIMAPNITGKLEDRKIGGPKALSFGEVRSGFILGTILLKNKKVTQVINIIIIIIIIIIIMDLQKTAILGTAHILRK
jgi:hypothetical protein